MTKHYTLNTLFQYIRAQKRELWLTNLYGVLATLFFLPTSILIPLLIDEVLLDHPGKIIGNGKAKDEVACAELNFKGLIKGDFDAT